VIVVNAVVPTIMATGRKNKILIGSQFLSKIIGMHSANKYGKRLIASQKWAAFP